MKNTTLVLLLLVGSFTCLFKQASALELDWTGQFRSEFHYIHDYVMDNTQAAYAYDDTRYKAGGYYIPSGGSNSANFTTLFLKLKPKAIVNDNIYIKSEWWVGDPLYSIFGGNSPYGTDQRMFYSTQSRGSTISAQRLWGEFLSDFGTLQVGRAPLNFGLGVVWSSGDGMWDRYESTGDMVRLISKFGSFTFSPAIISYSAGNNFGGSTYCASSGGAPYPPCTPNSGVGSVTDYSLMIKYENPDEDMEAGVNFIKRLGASSQDPNSGYDSGTGTTTATSGTGSFAGFNYNTWDIYLKKRLGKFTIAGELPLANGTVGGLNYSAYGLATEGEWHISDTWQILTKLGTATGQENSPTSALPDYKGFYFNPNYRLGLIMFNYQLANFAGPTTQNSAQVSSSQLRSPWDNPLTNVQYLQAKGVLSADKWKFNLGAVFAKTNTAAAQGQYFYNMYQRGVSKNVAIKDQSKSLGWELDSGTTFQWDEYFQFGWDLGFFFPGDFYTFSNSATQDNLKKVVWASVFKVGVSF